MYVSRVGLVFLVGIMFALGTSTAVAQQNYGSIQQHYSPGYNSGNSNQSVPYRSLSNRSLSDRNSNYRSVNYHNLTNGRIAIPWHQSLVKEREFDFGVVATASHQEHVFEFENTTESKLLLMSVRTSCGCTKPSVLTSEVEPGEMGRVKAVLETRKFQGKRGATLTVAVQKMGQTVEYGELQFAVRGKIRKDVVFNPGEVAFKNVSMTAESSQAVRVSYAGKPDWEITDIKSSSPHLTVESRETRRDLQTGRINYELIVKLDSSQPAGHLSEFLTIVTNDAKTTGMPIRVTGQVNPTLEAAPIKLGVISQGQKLRKKWIIRGESPFEIERIVANNPAIRFESSAGKKTLHIVNYTLDTSRLGKIEDEVTIVTKADSDSTTKVNFSAQIVAATMAGNRAPNP